MARKWNTNGIDRAAEKLVELIDDKPWFAGVTIFNSYPRSVIVVRAKFAPGPMPSTEIPDIWKGFAVRIERV